MADFARRSSRTSMRSKQLGQLLAENGDVTSEQIAQALKSQETQGGLIGAILQRMGACGSDAIGNALSKQIQVTEVVCEEIDGAEDAAKLVQKDFCLKEKLCPFERLGNLLCIVMGNPLNRKAISDIEAMTRMKVKAFRAHWPSISELIERSYSIHAAPTKNAPEHGPLDDFSLELSDPASAPAPKKSASQIPTASVRPVAPVSSHPSAPHQLEETVLQDDDIIIPPSHPAESDESGDLSAGPTGILEIPMDDEPVASHPAPHAPKMVQPPEFQTKIKGLENIGSGNAELVDIAKRKTMPAGPPAKKRDPRIAQVNIPLDRFDPSAATETIDTAMPPPSESMEEIENSGFEAISGRHAEGVLVALKIVPDTYFYSGGAPKNAPRSDDLMDIIEALPVAEVLAESIADFERKNGAGGLLSATDSGNLISMGGTTMAGKSRVELQRAPATPMAALKLGEGEFQKLTLSQVEDSLGEWEWTVASTGPVPVDAFED